MAVSFQELPGFPTYSFSENGEFVVTTERVVDWDDLTAYAQELQPVAFSAGSVVVTQPGKEWEGDSNFRVRDFKAVPHFGTEEGFSGTGADATTGVQVYNQAKFTINYVVPKANPTDIEGSSAEELDPVKLLTHSIQGGGQFLTVDDIGLKWFIDDEPLPEDAMPGIWVGTTQHSVQWEKVENPNWVALESLKSHVNDSLFTLRGLTYNVDQVMYLNYSASRDVFTDGTRAWNLTINFETKVVQSFIDAALELFTGTSIYSAGHNHFWRPDDTLPGFYRVVRTDGSPVYSRADLTQLFQTG